MTPNDTHDEIPSIVPERDELVSHRKQKRVASAVSRDSDTPAGRTSGGVIFMLSLLFLGMCGTGGGAYYFYQQSELTKADLVKATQRIASLEGTLNQMDESTKQSAMGLLQRVDNNTREIDKLWGARNTMKTEVEKQGVALNAVQKAANELEGTVSNHTKELAQHGTQLGSATTRIDQVVKNMAGMDNLGQQLTTLNADLNRTKNSMTKLESGVRAVEQDIEAVNVFRLQTNQSINNLQNSVNALQQKVGK